MKAYIYQNTEACCPLCSEKKAKKLWSCSSQEAAQHFVLKEGDSKRHEALREHIETLWGKQQADIVQCENCQFTYSFPYVAGDAKFYGLAYLRTGYPRWKWEFEKSREALQSKNKNTTRILELGAGDGAFVRALLADGFQADNMLCTEYSDYGKKTIEALGIKCLAQDIRELQTEEVQGFDAICFYQVLEHLDGLDELFRQLGKLLKPQGELHIAVPNNIQVEQGEREGSLLDMPPNHVGRWNKKAFLLFGQKHGFSLQEYAVEEGKKRFMAKQFIQFRMLRRSQRAGSIENRLLSIQKPLGAKIARYLCFGINALRAIPALLRIDLRAGNSQWLIYKKQEDA